jgi:histidinol-phosphate aminotransferase
MNNWPAWLPLRDELRSLSPYGAPQVKNVVQLNTNENPFSLPKEVQSAILQKIQTVVADLNRYPDRDAVRLRSKLADYVSQRDSAKISVENIWAANGSNEILQLLFLACGGAGRIALGFTPSYSVHPLIAQITGTQWIAGSRNSDFTIDEKEALIKISEVRPSLIFLTTPNNPSGTATPFETIERIAKKAAEIGALLIVDEAYSEFSSERSAIHLIDEYPHVVTSRTMSKAFAFAGARVGYMVADARIIDAALVTRLPYHLSALTQAAAEVAIDHSIVMQAGIEALVESRAILEKGIAEVGWKSFSSSANFILFTGFDESSHSLWQKFLDRGILIRDIGIEGYLRVTVGTAEENTRFLAALNEIAQ